MTNVNIVQYK